MFEAPFVVKYYYVWTVLNIIEHVYIDKTIFIQHFPIITKCIYILLYGYYSVKILLSL